MSESDEYEVGIARPARPLDFSQPDQRRDSRAHLFHDMSRSCAYALSLPPFPIQILHMISEYYTQNWQTSGQWHFERVALLLIRDGADDGQSCLAVVNSRGENEGRTAACLLMACLRMKINPDHIACLWNIFANYHVSRPTAPPQPVSSCLFSGVIPATNSVNVRLFSAAFNVSAPGSDTINSTQSPSAILACSKILFGIRTATLFPQRINCVCIEISRFYLSKVYTNVDTIFSRE